jgi:hypothetical protein
MKMAWSTVEGIYMYAKYFKIDILDLTELQARIRIIFELENVFIQAI